MQIKELRPYTLNILNQCDDYQYCLKMLEALDEDMGVDAYQDTQPGGGNCVSKNRKEYEKYAMMLCDISVASAFKDLYKNANRIYTHLRNPNGCRF